VFPIVGGARPKDQVRPVQYPKLRSPSRNDTRTSMSRLRDNQHMFRVR